jgi:hypothetical protein
VHTLRDQAVTRLPRLPVVESLPDAWYVFSGSPQCSSIVLLESPAFPLIWVFQMHTIDGDAEAERQWRHDANSFDQDLVGHFMRAAEILIP